MGNKNDVPSSTTTNSDRPIAMKHMPYVRAAALKWKKFALTDKVRSAATRAHRRKLGDTTEPSKIVLTKRETSPSAPTRLIDPNASVSRSLSPTAPPLVDPNASVSFSSEEPNAFADPGIDLSKLEQVVKDYHYRNLIGIPKMHESYRSFKRILRATWVLPVYRKTKFISVEYSTNPPDCVPVFAAKGGIGRVLVSKDYSTVLDERP